MKARAHRLLRSGILVAWGALCVAANAAGFRQDLPVFLADNHAETFGWITRTFDPDRAHVMVLVDAHTDASAVERSEEVREGLRRVPSDEARRARIESWRREGRIQAFNWIEPLMPRPVDSVVWLAAPQLGEAERDRATDEAVSALDGRLEVEPRSSGSFAGRWRTLDLQGLREWNPGNRPVVLAFDLDFLAGMKPEEREVAFTAIWSRAMDWPGLEGVALSVSRPWLTDDREAEALVTLAVAAVDRTRGARLEIDAKVDDRPDDSLKAAELQRKGGPPPRWDPAHAGAEVKARLAALGSRLTITGRTLELPGSSAVIRPSGGQPDCDGVWRYGVGEEPVLRVDPGGGAEATGRVRWYQVVTVREAYDLLPATGLGKSFSHAPGRWIYDEYRSLGESADFQLAPETWRSPSGGAVWIAAEYETPEGWLPVPPVEIRIRTAEGFRGSLSECFGMPYVFGIAGVSADGLSGVETGWGSDCSNLLIHAWRRNGLALRWGDPGRLRSQLAVKAEKVGVADRVPITREEIEKGIAIDFGKHVAAVWEDREPLGILDGGDRVMHHLGGRPEIVSLAQLVETRPVFSVLVPRSDRGAVIRFAGDVVLAGEDREALPDFGRGEAACFLVNLEGIPSQHEPERPVRYDFRFPAGRLAWLKERGVDAVSLANNHAGDAGRAGLLEGIAALRAVGLGVCGAGGNEEEACRPLRLERGGVKLAVLGISAFDDLPAGKDQPGVACYPVHRDLLERQFALARQAGERIVAMVHAGKEYSPQVTDAQRELARWLASQGAAVVAGAHPHVTQREESHAGAVILYSLGNAVYPAALKGADSGEMRDVTVVPAEAPQSQ